MTIDYKGTSVQFRGALKYCQLRKNIVEYC